jgi:hypothetical protein
MARTSSVRHPANTGTRLLREDYLAICQTSEKDVDAACAAMILAQMDYWYTIRLSNREPATAMNKIAEEEGDTKMQSLDLYIYVPVKDLRPWFWNGLFGQRTLTTAFYWLSRQGFVTGRIDPRYNRRDKMWCFNPETVQIALDKWRPPTANRPAVGELILDFYDTPESGKESPSADLHQEEVQNCTTSRCGFAPGDGADLHQSLHYSIDSIEDSIEDKEGADAHSQANDAPLDGKPKRSRLPENWQCPKAWIADAKSKFPDVDVDLEATIFHSDFVAKGTMHVNWQAAFRTWMGREQRKVNTGRLLAQRGSKPNRGATEDSRSMAEVAEARKRRREGGA